MILSIGDNPFSKSKTTCFTLEKVIISTSKRYYY